MVNEHTLYTLLCQSCKCAIAMRCAQVEQSSKPTAAGRRRCQSWEGQLDALLERLVNEVDLHTLPSYLPEADLFDFAVDEVRCGARDEEFEQCLGALPD